ncbi:MAG: THUMP domain-containing protein [Candidatus Caldarchaeum sp.]
MVKCFFLLSGENPYLSAAELQHILEIHRYGQDFQLLTPRVAVATTPPSLLSDVVFRAAYTKIAGVYLGHGRTSILSEGNIPLDDGWRMVEQLGVEKFRVDVVKLGGAAVNSVEVEKKTAEALSSLFPKMRVCMDNPDIIVGVVVSPDTYVAGLLKVVKPKHFFQLRRAGRKPFRIPSALQPKLARCLVNLSVASLDCNLLDPFAGSGAVVVEAALLGHEAVGLELRTWISNGMAVNTSFFCPSVCHVVQGDAVRMPFRKAFAAVATDPPYGKSSTLAGRGFRQLLARFFEAVQTLLQPGGRVSIVVPDNEYENLLDASKGFRPLQRHDVYVHKSLTRRVVVLKLE